MKPIRNIFTLLVIIFVVTVGCTGFSQVDMNRELTGLHAQRIAMNNEIKANREDKGNTEKIRDFELLLADIDNNLLELAMRARTTGMQAEEKGDDLNAISFYRIAAVAAWLGGAPNITAYTDSGSKKCDELKRGDGAAPRDCAMLKTIPYLAINAARAPELNEVATEEKKLAEIRDEDFIKWIEEIKRTKIRDRTEQTFNDFYAAAVQIVTVQQELGSIANASSPRFIDALGMRAFTVACNANYAFVILGNLTLPEDFDESRIPADLRPEMQQWLQGLTRAKELKAKLDQELITEANTLNCESP
jgi:succinate dehydrogenase flavin-adding protein (antitoxin of CptAB toxin-antitoxin module)